MKTKKVAITGAAGQIGYSLLFRIASGQMFGPDVAVELSLIELERALPALEGVKMELQDCAFPLLKSIHCTADLNEGFKDADWSLLVGSVPRSKGMLRKDLLEINGKIFVGQGKAIADNAKSDSKVLVVGNPCNTNCLIALAQAKSKMESSNFFAMTMLDENRAKAQLALKASVGVDQIDSMNIWGNHSATQFPCFERASVDGKNLTSVITDQAWLEGDFIKTVQQRGAAIIGARGASSAASAANAVVDTVYNIENPTNSEKSFSVAICSNGEYGVSEGLMFSYPVTSKNGKVSVVEGLELSVFAQDKIKATEKELSEEREAVKNYL